MTEMHGHAFDVYSMVWVRRMLDILDGGAEVLKSWPADPPSQAKMERLVAAARVWHYGGTAAPADRQACHRLRERISQTQHAAGGGGGAVGDGGGGGGGGGSVGFSGRDVFPELGGGDVLTQVGDWKGGGILRTAASDGAAGSASTALQPLTDPTVPPPPLAAASPAAPRSRSGLGPAAKAALVLMLQCQEDMGARVALAGSPDCTRAAAEMLQSGSALEQRITAHLFWFTSRSQEGAAALFGETHGATPSSTPRPEAPTPAAPAAAAESPAPVPVPGVLGALLAATRCQDAHAAKAVAMALHNVLVSEGGAAAVEVRGEG
ncbi:hypothetical protein PLESTB_000229000 [Pleodorina starrii]|uniref:Uncharacterized protein n=1 Tax=Pleodorina starrii TaxID=330485 RepID=A0A9W6EY16_9CHLO|nr:hypothetical protein PLESTB_000229000 [Pleodorina starrii]